MSADRERDAPTEQGNAAQNEVTDGASLPPSMEFGSAGPRGAGPDRPAADGEGAANPVDPSAVALRCVKPGCGALQVAGRPCTDWDCPQQTISADEYREVEAANLALEQKLAALAPHGSCACSYDRPDDVCAHHSPALRAMEERASRAEARVVELERQLNEPWSDGENTWYRPTAWAYAQVCKVMNRLHMAAEARAEALAQESAKLREALIDRVDFVGNAFASDGQHWTAADEKALCAVYVPAGKLRRAAALLQPEEAARG